MALFQTILSLFTCCFTGSSPRRRARAEGRATTRPIKIDLRLDRVEEMRILPTMVEKVWAEFSIKGAVCARAETMLVDHIGREAAFAGRAVSMSTEVRVPKGSSQPDLSAEPVVVHVCLRNPITRHVIRGGDLILDGSAVSSAVGRDVCVELRGGSRFYMGVSVTMLDVVEQ